MIKIVWRNQTGYRVLEFREVFIMDRIKWTEEFSVGVQRFDNQHARIIALINKLIEDSKASVNSELISDALSLMTEYSQNHFKDEEKSLEEYGYEDFDSHKEKHKRFLKKTMKFNQATMVGVTEVPVLVLEYLKDWWVVHILVEDMKYKPLLKDKVLL